MFNTRWVALAVLVSSVSSFGAVSFKEKRLRVESLMKMHQHAPMLAFEAFQRELGYEKQGLSIEARTKNESNLLAEKIRAQVITAFQAALKEHKSPELAREEIRDAIERDLEQAAPDMRDELMKLANDTLDVADAGGASEEVELEHVEVALRKQVVSRVELLNKDDIDQDPIAPKVNPSKDSEKKDYASTSELMESLVSDRESSRWVSTANQTIKTAQVTKAETKVSMQVKMEFLGATIEAGPSISFKREISTDAMIMSEGLNPIITRDGTFDRFRRDRDNQVVMKNGKGTKRYVAFYCDADLKFETEYAGAGGFKYLGMGADVSVSKVFSNNVNLQSRRIALPESVGNKTLTVKYISELCHGEFLKAKSTNSLTIRQTLDVMMRNVVSGLVFSNPKTKCVQDADCKGWFKNEVIALQKRQNTARCVEDTRDKFRFCQLRGQIGQNCAVIENNKRTSSGVSEFPCDWGLKCVKTESATYLFDYTWSYSKGQCRK